jgi:hypothetical protein
VIKKELVILLKTDLVPTLQERFENPQSGNLVSQERQEGKQRIKYYKFNEGTSGQTP